MRRSFFLYIACVAVISAGCLVSTPYHQLPQGYSETYRQILQRRRDVAPAAGLPPGPVFEEIEPPPMSHEPLVPDEVEITPPLPLSSGDAGIFEDDTIAGG